MARSERTLSAAPFDLTGPLPTGTTMLEASAGTGKTYAIVGLMIRYLAEGGFGLDRLLLITFSRAATHELRERARARLVTAELALRDPVAARGSNDELVRHLATAPDEQVRARHRRLRDALADFDAATIATTHGFCQRMLDAIGLAGDWDPGAVMVDSIDELVVEAAQDVYLGLYAGREAPPFPLSEALVYAREAVANPRARLSPVDLAPSSPAGERVYYARAVRTTVEERKRRRRLRDFDDLQILLRDALTDPEHGPAACARLRSMFSVILVDEFQDTDPVQWDILYSAFHGHRPLVLVGDPKQAIYGFRGADVGSYLAAAASTPDNYQLPANWRTDAPLIDALDRLYGEVALGDPMIVAREVAAQHRSSRISGGPALRLRYLGRAGVGPATHSGVPKVAGVRDAVIADVAADVARTLAQAQRLFLEADPGRDLAPGDIAVLVRRKEHVAKLQVALGDLGVPAVATGGDGVFATAAALDWLRVLQAMESPGRADRARLAALTAMLGIGARELDEGDDELVSRISGRLRGWAAIFASAGFAAMFDALAAESELDRRLLSQRGGERTITDLRHLAELMQQVALESGAGLTAVTRWLTDRISDQALASATERSRRLATDSAAVQIMTVHAAKGLQFPVVYLPFGWDGGGFGVGKVFTFHDEHGARVLDVGGDHDRDYRKRVDRAVQEDRGEELRLFYVGATRAQCRLVLWWAPATTTEYSALHRLLNAAGRGEPPPERPRLPRDDAAAARLLGEWAAPLGGTVSVEPVDAAHRRPAPPFRGADDEYPELTLGIARRRIDHDWRRTSYSALIAGAQHGGPGPGVGSESDTPAETDEPTAEPTAAPAGGGAPSPMNGLSGGAVFGTLVHEILERVDTDAADLPAELLRRCRAALAFTAGGDDPQQLASALYAVLTTPLGEGPLAGYTLASVRNADRLAELEFELPLAGAAGRDTGPAPTLAALAELLRAHLPPGDPLAGYPDRLATVPGAVLRGYLTGSIDSVLRIGPEGDRRFTVVDYKTNRLAHGDLTVADYGAAAMAREMVDSHYVLQALLYSVALHRFLRWRLADYRPERHLGPVQYHFVRGMIGPHTPAGHGVFEWNPSAELVVAASALLHGQERA